MAVKSLKSMSPVDEYQWRVGIEEGREEVGHHTYVAGDQISEFAVAAFDFWKIH